VSVSIQSNSGLIAANLDAVMREDSSVVEHFLAPDVEIYSERDTLARPGTCPAARLGRLPCSAPLAWPPPWSRGGQEFSGTHAQLGRNHVRPARGDLRGQQSGGIRLVPAACPVHGTNRGYLSF